MSPPSCYQPAHGVTVHDIVVESLRVEPAIALEAVARAFPDDFDAGTPAVTVGDPVLENLLTTEHRADLALLLGNPLKPSLAVVVEVQTDVYDDKPWRWPIDVSTLADRHRCPVCLVVAALKTRTAKWAKSLPRTSPSLTLRPAAIDAGAVPGFDEVLAD